jgi:tetratricopeptide (TPR) repeat protein
MLISVLLIGILYFGNFTPKKKDRKPASTMQAGISFEQYAERQLDIMSDDSLKNDILSLQQKFNQSDKNEEKAAIASSLAALWAAANVASLEAYYLFQAADLNKNPQGLALAGDRLLTLFRVSQDTVIKNNLITFALRSLETASRLDPDNLELKVRLGAAYVEGTPEPMKGITLLREVVDKDPENVEALILLGRFAILSGQFDRAKERLDKVLMLDPNNPEAIYFMAIAQEGLGNVDKAIELLEVCKKIVNNPAFDAEVNAYIDQLKNKK